MKKIFLFFFVFALNQELFSQNPFQQFDFLIGGWQGVETGMSGDGIGFRTYNYELDNNYIFQKNTSTFPKSEKKPMGEVHRDIGIFSYNSNDSSIVLREFHVEGFANIYELKKELSDQNKFVFITRLIENNPGNWAAKLILEKISDKEFIEYFEIATDGVNFKPFLKNHWEKVE